jgi:hypothetical protein
LPSVSNGVQPSNPLYALLDCSTTTNFLVDHIPPVSILCGSPCRIFSTGIVSTINKYLSRILPPNDELEISFPSTAWLVSA